MKRVVILLAALSASSPAVAQEYREFSLADGRAFVAEVVRTEATGFFVRLPQGDARVGFGDLANMADVDATAYANQPPWPVVLLASPAQADVAAALRLVPAVRVYDGADPPPGTPPEAWRTARACGADLDCAVGALADAPWAWVVAATDDSDALRLRGAVSTGATRTRIDLPRVDAERLAYAAFDVLGVSAPEGFRPEPALASAPAPAPTAPASPPPATSAAPVPAPAPPPSRSPAPSPASSPVPAPTPAPTPPPAEPVVVAPVPAPAREPVAWTEQRVVAMSFAPVPGLPSLAQGDMTGFALAWAAVLPATAAVVGVSGASSPRAVEHVALSVGGFYVATVVANQALGMRSLRRSQTVVWLAPRADGAVVTASGRF